MNHQNPHQKSHLRELIALTLVPKLGAQRIRLLLQAVGEPQDIFRLDTKTLIGIEGIGPALSQTIQAFNDWKQVDAVIEKTRKAGARIITYRDKDYPDLLREIYDPPILLWIKGREDGLKKSAMAVVGTRRATRYGLDKTRDFCAGLVKNGIGIVSGLAYGIDAAAHTSTLEAGGITIGVLGSGIDVIYPQKHVGLASDIIDNGGAIISEFPPGTQPDAGNFPERNRIVSGLTLGTLVVESGLKGGSMLTAQSALTQNREVFVIPHSLNNVNGVGCNHLIKRAAGKLVQSVDDILEEFPALPLSQRGTGGQEVNAKRAAWKDLELDEEASAVCDALEDGPLHIDALSKKLNRSPQQLLAKLLELEMKECIRQKAGRNFELI